MRTAILLLALARFARLQEPTGTIMGMAQDLSGAVVSGVHVRVVSAATGWPWQTVTSDQGTYSITSLPAGEYTVSAEAAGFPTMVRTVVVGAGQATTTDFSLRLGEVSTVITVDAVLPQMRLDSHALGGTITRDLIEGLPVNGRSPSEFAKLEPMVQPPSRASSNRTFVSIGGAPGGNAGRSTRQTTDGVSTMAVGNGGSAMGFSQEVVQELQISTANFDLSTGPTFSGAINAVTRSGGNDVHGSVFYFFRDHKLAAYPALQRDAADPDPFFQRQQFGLAVGGPIRRNRFFFFTNWERNDQRGVGTTTLLGQDFGHFSRITASPFSGDQFSIRIDGRLSGNHTAFLRYANDANRAFGPATNQQNAYPSAWPRQSARADQGVLGLTSVIRPTLVNDIRASYFYANSTQVPPTLKDCHGCLGIGAPAIKVQDAGLTVGGSDIFINSGRRIQLTDSVAWQAGTHRVRFGVDWEYNRGGPRNSSNEPATITLHSPDRARQSGIPTPAEFNTLEDILSLPLHSVTISVGDPQVRQANGGLTRTWNTFRFFFQDTWRPHSRLTVNYGLAWNVDRNLNYDLTKPPYLAPVLGEAGLGPTRQEWKNFSPSLGLAWTPSPDRETVVRAGAGMYYDFLFPQNLDTERTALGPSGLGRQMVSGGSIGNPLPGIDGVDVGTSLDFTTKPTLFTGSHLMAILPAIRAGLLQSPENEDASVQQIQVTKTLIGGGLNPSNFPSSSAIHASLGVARQVAKGFVLSTDFVYRGFTHVGIGSVDMNHFGSLRGPVIPKCDPLPNKDPHALCSNGVINVSQPIGRAAYRGLLLRADKRSSHGL
ncbi:MAG TPA: TonB-dependent receptor, partial [Terriglobia bacterium]|nr:TonB-dependent receptor [Terriglobia bacterium]